MSMLKKGNASEPVACPFCDERTVMATILTCYTFKSEHQVYTDGVNMDGDTMGQIFGDLANEPTIKVTSFYCTSCNKKWRKSEYTLEKDENGVNSFTKVEHPKKKRMTKEQHE